MVTGTIGGNRENENKKIHLFEPLTIRGLVLKNRIVVSPMCTYSSKGRGLLNDWHMMHLGSFAMGGAGLVFIEATGVSLQGRISPYCLTLHDDGQIKKLKRVVDLVHTCGAAIGIQIAHAGRKASCNPSWIKEPVPEELSWKPCAPSPIPWDQESIMPHELELSEIKVIIDEFVSAAKRANQAGIDVLEIHGAHGYLINQFLSAASNKRQDSYGGSFQNRCRFLFEVIESVRDVWPHNKPLFLRLSCIEWIEDDEGWKLEDTQKLVPDLISRGIDILDCSSGGNNFKQVIPIKPSYQVPFSYACRKSGIPTMAVGLITSPDQAENILSNGQADLIALGREMLRDKHWPLRAAHQLNFDIPWPRQYMAAKW